MSATRREFVQAGAAVLGGVVTTGMTGAACAAASESTPAVDGKELYDGFLAGNVTQELTTATALMDSTITFHHLMICYRDIDEALKLWRDVMGFTVYSDGPTSGEYFDPAVWSELFGYDTPTIRCCTLQHDTGAMLELHQPIDPPLTELPEDAFAYWHPGVLEIGLRVRNIDAWFEKIRAAGYKTTTEAVWNLATNDRSFLFYDCDGHMIQLWECERSPRWA